MNAPTTDIRNALRTRTIASSGAAEQAGPPRAVTRFEGGELIGHYTPETDPVEGGTVLVSEAALGVPGCRRVAFADLADGDILLGRMPVTEAEAARLSPMDLMEAADSQKIGRLSLPLMPGDPAWPFAVSLGLSRALGGLAATDEEIVNAFGAPVPVPLLMTGKPAKPTPEYDAISVNFVSRPRFVTPTAIYEADIRLLGAFKKGGRDPKVEVAAAVLAVIYGKPCPPADPTTLDIKVDIRISCLDRKAGEDGRRNGYEIPLKFEFHGESSVGNELCELANLYVKATQP